MKLKIVVSLIILMPACQSNAAADQSWWRMLSPNMVTTGAAYLIPLLVYQQRMHCSNQQISPYAYLAPLATTLAQTVVSSGQHGWQNALLTTLQWQIPAWALAYYLSRYKEQSDQAKKEDAQRLFREQYDKKLTDLLQEFDKVLINNRVKGLPKKLKTYYNDLVQLYDQLIKKTKILTPAQQLYIRYIAYKAAKEGILSEVPNFDVLMSSRRDIDLRRYIELISDSSIQAVSYWKEQGLTISDTAYDFVNGFMLLLQQNDLLRKIFYVIKYYQVVLDQKAQERQLLSQKYRQDLAKIIDNLHNPDVDSESLYINLKKIYRQLKQSGPTNKLFAPYDYIYAAVIAANIKPLVDLYLQDKQRDLESNNIEDQVEVLRMMNKRIEDISKIIKRSATLFQDITDANEKDDKQRIPELLAPIMMFVNELREKEQK